MRAARFSHYTHVLIVGVSNYTHRGLADLPACANEAKALEEVLTDAAGCAIPAAHVIRFSDGDATAAAITGALERLSSQRTADDTLIIYLAGHGVVLNGEFSFVTGGTSSTEFFRASALDAALSQTSARGVLLIADCCGGADLAAHAPTFFKTPHHSEFRLFISASRGGQSSWELSEQRRSLFTARLLEVLRGKVKLGARGEIYYLDLYRHLHTAVQADAERLLGSSHLQEPVAIGSHGGDPLLFLHRDQSLSQVRVNTQKLTREDFNRRLRFAVGGALATAVLAIGGYWAFLEGHQYLSLRDTITLVHGYPGLSGFGLPRDAWQFEFGPQSVAPSHELLDGNVTLSRGENASDRLEAVLRPGARALLQTWRGRTEEAREVLLQAGADGSIGLEGIRALQTLSLAGRETEAAALVAVLPPEEATAMAAAIARTDAELAITSFRRAAAGDETGYDLNLLGAWTAPCTPAVQEWLDTFTNRGVVRGRTVALTAVIAGCRYPEDLLYEDLVPEDGAIALRLTDPARATALNEQINKELADIVARSANAVGDLRSPDVSPGALLFMMHVARYFEGVPCLPSLLPMTSTTSVDTDSTEALIAAAELVARACDGYHIEAEVNPENVEVISMAPDGTRTPLLSISLAAPAAIGTIGAVDTMIRHRPDGARQMVDALLRTQPRSDVRLALVQKLAFLRGDTSDLASLRVPEYPPLDRAILEATSQRDPSLASSWLRTWIEQGNADIQVIEALASVPLTQDDRRAVLEAAAQYPATLRAIVTTLVGSPDAVVRQLTNPSPDVRTAASEYAALRPDWDQIARRAQDLTTYPNGALLDAEARRRELLQMTAWVSRTPSWARAWLLRRLEQLRATNSAAQIHLVRLRREHGLPP